MNADDAIYSGFADTYIPYLKWNEVIETLEATGDLAVLETLSEPAPDGVLRGQKPQIDAQFGGETLTDIVNALRADDSDFAAETLKKLSRNSPLSMACAVEIIHRLRGPVADIFKALELEYRFTFRAMEHGDFLEGIRAAVIDKDRAPVWKHTLDPPPSLAATKMLMPLGANSLTFETTGQTL